MSFTLQVWKEQAAAKLHQIGNYLDRPRVQSTPYLLYGYLSSLSLWPLVQAAQDGSLSPIEIGIALGGIAGAVGTNLLANQIQNWKDRTDKINEAEVAEWVAASVSANSELHQALETILEKLDAVSEAKASLAAADRQWFLDTLQAELAKLSGQTKYQAKLKGSGAIAQGPGSVAAGKGGMAIGGNVEGGIRLGKGSKDKDE